MLYCYKSTPKSFATDVGDIGLPQGEILKSGNYFSTPVTRILRVICVFEPGVLAGPPRNSVRSEFITGVALLNSLVLHFRYILKSPTLQAL